MSPKMLLQERARINMEILSKRQPVTLEEARAQALWLKIQSSNINNELEIKKLIKNCYPNLTQVQLDSLQDKLMELVNYASQPKKKIELK